MTQQAGITLAGRRTIVPPRRGRPTELPDGGMAGIPDSQMAMIPGATHFTILSRTDVLVPIVVSFLDAPMPDVQVDAASSRR